MPINVIEMQFHDSSTGTAGHLSRKARRLMIAEIEAAYLNVTVVHDVGDVNASSVILSGPDSGCPRSGRGSGFPRHGCRFSSTKRAQSANLRNTLMLPPGNGRDRAVGTVSEFRCADGTSFTTDARQGKVQCVIKAEDIGSPAVIDDSRMIPGRPAVRIHDHSLVFPGTSGAGAHGVSNAFRATV